MFDELLDDIRREAAEFASEMPFRDYLAMVADDSTRLRLSHRLILDAVKAAGVDAGPDDEPVYRLFAEEVFGADDTIRQVMDYFAAAARGLEVRKRILLLLGPAGCGKSTLLNAVKRGLEEYTRTSDGAVYAIKGCPVHEEPLHLIPPHHRDRLNGLPVEGELCPHCRWMAREVYGGDIAKVPVERVAFSTSDGVGVGTFVATDPRSEDLTRLVGRVDRSQLLAGDPKGARRAFRLDGELCAANRGLVDLLEVFKMDERFLSVLLTLAQEQFIKVSGPVTMYADEAVVAQSNLAEYEAVVGDPKAVALQDRLVVIRLHYVLSVHDEVRIYEKLLGNTDPRVVHMSPLALPAAATLAVLSRLEPPHRSGWDLRKKLLLYDGRFVPDADENDLRAFRDAAPDEGLTGISPRYVINGISQALGSNGCLSGLALLEDLWEGLRQRAGFREEDREDWTQVFVVAREEYDDLIRRSVRRAMLPGFDEAAVARAHEVLRDLDRWSAGAAEQELGSLREVERVLGVPQYRRESFRESLQGRLRAADTQALHLAEPHLTEAVGRLLLPSWRTVARTLAGYEDDGEDVRREWEPVRRRLVEEQGFCESCAEDLLRYAAQLAAPRRERGRRARGGLRWLTG